MKKQCATAYKRGGRIFLVGASQTAGRYGPWIDIGPHLALSADDSPDAIGTQVFELLERSRQGVSYPHDPKTLERPLLDLAQLKSWDTFVRGTTHCFIERDDAGVRIIPSSSDGSGFIPRTQETIELDRGASEEAVGAALHRALE